MGLWAYLQERLEYRNQAAEARRALSEILELTYAVGHSCPDDVLAKVAVRTICLEAVNKRSVPLPKLRDAFTKISIQAEKICWREIGAGRDFQGKDAAVAIVNICQSRLDCLPGQHH